MAVSFFSTWKCGLTTPYRFAVAPIFAAVSLPFGKTLLRQIDGGFDLAPALNR